MPYEPGKYEVIRPVNIRRDAKIVTWWEGLGKKRVQKSNYRGMYTTSKQIDIFEILVDTKNDVWGRVTEYDATGHANWICIKNANGEFAREAEADENGNLLEAMMMELSDLKAWARTKGYTG